MVIWRWRFEGNGREEKDDATDEDVPSKHISKGGDEKESPKEANDRNEGIVFSNERVGAWHEMKWTRRRGERATEEEIALKGKEEAFGQKWSERRKCGRKWIKMWSRRKDSSAASKKDDENQDVEKKTSHANWKRRWNAGLQIRRASRADTSKREDAKKIKRTSRKWLKKDNGTKKGRKGGRRGDKIRSTHIPAELNQGLVYVGKRGF